MKVPAIGEPWSPPAFWSWVVCLCVFVCVYMHKPLYVCLVYESYYISVIKTFVQQDVKQVT
jgi:hypothetical protein